MKTKNVDVSELWTSSVDEKPEDYDFWENKFAEDWNIPFKQTDEELESGEFTPLMNLFYPLPEFEEKRMDSDEIKESLDDAGSVTLIEKLKTGEKGLALSGGGMDLSWDICRG
ncbi:hypothetical protein DRQ25_12965 [Candidatus Fermentibacteria bacterium]|nr:MAG: hypothetical protein DRQ25_12965 [Candidatus Fermentibacteria bacterium]